MLVHERESEGVWIHGSLNRHRSWHATVLNHRSSGPRAVEWVTRIDVSNLIAQVGPDALGQLNKMLVETNRVGVPRSRKVHREVALDPSRTSRHDHDAIRHRDGLSDIVGHEENSRRRALPEADELLLQHDLG